MKISCTGANNANFQHGWCGLGAAGLWGHCTPFWVVTISFSVNPNRLWWFSYIQCLRACQREQIYTHCTMVKLKNGIKSSQLWTIISPPIFNGNLSNFERWCINIRKIIKKILFAKCYERIFLKSQTPVGGLCASQDWSQKIPLKKIKNVL